MTRALLLIDIQRDYFDDGLHPLVGIDAAASKAAGLLDRARRDGRPVFHVRHEFASADAPFFKPGTNGTEIADVVLPRNDEPVVTKAAVNAFVGTDLHERLRAAGVDELVIAGAMSHMCIQAATRAAADLGFACTVAHDACATSDLEFDGRVVPAGQVHDSSMAALAFGYADVVTASDVD